MNKRYKLLKDILDFQAGLIVWRNERGGYDSEPLLEDFWSLGEFLLQNDPEDHPKWFEPLDTPTRWRAELENSYWIVDSRCDRLKLYDSYDEDSDRHHEVGNYFRTKESAQAAAEAIKNLLKEFHESNEQ